MPSTSPFFELTHITKKFGKRTILHDVSFAVQKGEVFGIIGSSGGGKSTLFKILMGYYKPDQGDVLLKGKNVLRNLKAFKRAVGYTTQDDSFYKKLTAYENMRYYAELYNVNPKEKDNKDKSIKEYLVSILRLVRLDQHKDLLVEKMSGGMRRRLNFAISLVHDPDILLLDEPTTGLDPKLVEEFWNIIQDVRKRGKTIIVTSHIFPEVEENCDHVGFLHQGKIVALIDLKKNPGKLHTLFMKIAGAQA